MKATLRIASATLFGLFALTTSPAAFSAPSTAEALRLIPFPKGIELLNLGGQFTFGPKLVLDISDAEAKNCGNLLNEELKRAGLPPVQILELPQNTKAAFRLSSGEGPYSYPVLPTNSSPEGYALVVLPSQVLCVGKESSGLFYGMQTLCQLIRANREENKISCLRIRDWPSLRWRCFQDDMTRGPSSTLDTLKFEAGLGAYLKFNLMTFYMEYQYAFKKHPKIGPTNGSLTPEDLSALVGYVKPLHLDILGNQQSFGHFGAILKHPEYAAMREVPDVLTPVNEKTYHLLDDLYSEVCPLVPFPWFNVCCDETWGLGTGPSKELAGQIGVGGVYVRHIRRVHDLLKDKYQKRMMMWGDIILQHPDKLNEIPKDTIMLTWGYDARRSFEDQIIPFAKSGYEFFICPGVNNWSRILPDFGVAVTNIQNFVRDGIKHGALGMINTDWEDDGEALNGVKWYCDAWAAECAWNASSTSLEAFNRRVGAVLFGESKDHFGRAIALLERTHRMPSMKGMNNARFWEKDFVPKTSEAAAQSIASNLLAVVRPALQHLQSCRKEARCNQHVLRVYEFGARRMELIGQRMLDGVEAGRLYKEAIQAPSDTKLARVEELVRNSQKAHEALGREFSELWLSESKPYALDWTTRRYANRTTEYKVMLTKLALARVACQNGKALPSAEEVGLALPKTPAPKK